MPLRCKIKSKILESSPFGIFSIWNLLNLESSQFGISWQPLSPLFFFLRCCIWCWVHFWSTFNPFTLTRCNLYSEASWVSSLIFCSVYLRMVDTTCIIIHLQFIQFIASDQMVSTLLTDLLIHANRMGRMGRAWGDVGDNRPERQNILCSINFTPCIYTSHS